MTLKHRERKHEVKLETKTFKKLLPMFEETTLFNHLAQEERNIVLDKLGTRVGNHKDKQIYKCRVEDETGITDRKCYKNKTKHAIKEKVYEKSNG